MAATWDKRSARQLRSLQDELVRSQVRAVAGSAAYWKQRFADIGRVPSSIEGVTALAAVPAVGERDVSPTGDPADMARLVLHGGERQFALHTSGPQLRRALRLRLARSAGYRRIVEAEVKPTSYMWSGLGFRYPLASTRGDLDAVARAGSRLWQVLGLTEQDALVSAVPVAATPEHNALQLAAMAVGAPALFPGDGPDAVVAAARLAPPTVLAVPTLAAGEVVRAVGAADALGRLTTLLLVGAPTADERAAAVVALRDAGVTSAAVLAVHAPSGARVLWAECRESGGSTGLHTYPDLDVVQLVDPDSGDPDSGDPDSGDPDSGELVVTQLGLRGSALLRWRTGDLVAGVDTAACPACGRNVARVVGTARHALVVATDGGRPVDVRTLTGALAGRADVQDWRVVIGGRTRDGHGQVVVHLVTSADPGEVSVGAAADIRAVTGRLPTQLVTTDADSLAALTGTALTRRVLLRR